MIRRGLMAAAVACAAVGVLPVAAEAGVPAWTTYHHDSARSGIDPDSSSPMTPTQVWQTPALDGQIWGQPLVYGSRVYVATENDTVYALDFSTGAIVWSKHLARAVTASPPEIPCGDISPTVGITSTPVIDPATGRIYVVADTWDGNNASSVAHKMYALNLSDGSIAVGPVPVDPPGSTPTDQLQRASLALDAGEVVIGYGGNDGDCGSYHGWLVAVPEGGGPIKSFEVDGSGNGGAVWGSGNAPAVDSSGDIWAATGNNTGTSSYDHQESVLKLDPSLNLLDWWAPSTWSNLDSSDTDLGSTMPLLLPNGLVFEIGKEGVGYLLNASNLGRTHTAPPAYSASVCSGSWGGGIYVNGVIYVACSDGMHALKLDTTTRTFAPLSPWPVDGNAVGPPIFAGGLIWSADYNGSNLYGLDPSTGAETFVSANLSGFEHFASPSAAGGRLFVANQDTSSTSDDVTAFQIAKTPPPSPTAVSVTSSSDPSLVNHAVTLTAAIAPVPDAGTVAFSDGRTPITGCGAVPVSISTGRASCTTIFRSAGRHGIVAEYSGDAYYASASGSLTQSVVMQLPSISNLRVRVVHHRLRLTLSLSEPARLTVVVWKLVPGRRVHRRCRTRARHGRRCTATFMALRLHLNAQAGTDRLRPRMRPLPPGRYLVTVTALAADGGRSLPTSALVTVPRR